MNSRTATNRDVAANRRNLCVAAGCRAANADNCAAAFAVGVEVGIAIYRDGATIIVKRCIAPQPGATGTVGRRPANAHGT